MRIFLTRRSFVLRSVVVLLTFVAGNLLVLPTGAALGPVEVVGSHGDDSPGWTATPPAAPVSLETVAIDTAGNLYQIERSIGAIVKVSPTGTETVFAGRGTVAPSTTPTPATSVALGSIGLIALDPQGNLYLTAERRLLKIDTSGLLTLVAGGGSNPPSTTLSPATSVSLTGVRSIAFGPDQAVYLSDISNGVIAKVDQAGMLAVVAGGGDLAPSRFPTPATTVNLKDVGLHIAQVSIAFGPNGTLLLADNANNDIYEVASGMLTIIGYDGSHPESIAVSPSGTVFLGGVMRVNLLTDSGSVTPLPVNFPVGFPTQVAHDGANNLYVTSRGSGEIVRVQNPGDLPPDAPTGVHAVRGDRSALVSWNPASDNGSPITGYTVTSSPGGITSTVAGSATGATVTGLTNGTTYTFTVKAVSAFGTSVASAPSNWVSPAGAPQSPTGVQAARGDRSAQVWWYRQQDNGSPITGYTVTSSPGGITSTVTGSATDATVTGLTNGTAYTFTVVATNSVGDSIPSGPSNTVTPMATPSPIVTPPTLPTDPAAFAPSRMNAPKLVARGRKVVVTWKAAVANGSPVIRYLIDISKGGDRNTRASARKTVFKRLKPGRYRIRIAARNAMGTSPYSAWVRVRIR